MCGENTDIDSTARENFSTLCSLIDDFVVAEGGAVNLKTFLDSSSPNDPHTFFAPTNEAFEHIRDLVDELSTLKLNDIVEYESTVAGLLQLHILPDTYLEADFNCDETYETLNLSGIDRYSQRQKTKCRGTAAFFNQIGVGNTGHDADQPTVGKPVQTFSLADFDTTDILTTSVNEKFASNVISCGGVIHVVDEVLLPRFFEPYYGSKGSKGGYGKSGKFWKNGLFNRQLKEVEEEDSDRGANLENRRARLESLLVDANGNTESFE